VRVNIPIRAWFIIKVFNNLAQNNMFEYIGMVASMKSVTVTKQANTPSFFI
jgi:hypothetical protein